MKLSVVIPSFQAAEFFEETIRSVLAQTGPEVELILIDGASTDGTIDIIKKYEADIAYWISEPDRGQADAINKAMQRVTGDVVAIFNADDFYADGIFAEVEKAWRRNPRAIQAAPVANFYTRGKEMLLRPHGMTFENIVQYWRGQSLWHMPGLFWPREVLETVGGMDVSLHYSFDYDFLIRALRHFEVEYLDHVAAGFRLHRNSKTISQSGRMMEETAAVSQRYWPLLDAVDRDGFARAQHAARVRRGASYLIRGNRDGFALLREGLRQRPLATIAQLAWLGPSVLAERLSRLLPARHL